MTLSVGDGARQPGLTLSLAPRWGASATASDALWQEEVYGQATGGTGADARALDARVDYGLTLPAGGLLTPFGVYGQSPSGRRLQVGLLISRLGPVGLEVSGERTPSHDPGGGVYRVSVQGGITVGGADHASASGSAGPWAAAGVCGDVIDDAHDGRHHGDDAAPTAAASIALVGATGKGIRYGTGQREPARSTHRDREVAASTGTGWAGRWMF